VCFGQYFKPCPVVFLVKTTLLRAWTCAEHRRGKGGSVCVSGGSAIFRFIRYFQ